jgi:hypothetical protein
MHTCVLFTVKKIPENDYYFRKGLAARRRGSLVGMSAMSSAIYDLCCSYLMPSHIHWAASARQIGVADDKRRKISAVRNELHRRGWGFSESHAERVEGSDGTWFE